MPAPVLRALLRSELLQCPAFPFSALSSQLLTLRHQSASTPVVYTGKNIHLNFSSTFLNCKALSGIPMLAGDNIEIYITTMLLHCLHLWCYLVRCYPQHTMVVKGQQTKYLPGLLHHWSCLFLFRFFSYWMLQGRLNVNFWSRISLAVCFNDMMRQLFPKIPTTQPSQTANDFQLFFPENPSPSIHFASGHLYYSQYVFNRLHKLSIASHFSKTIVACCTRLLLLLTIPYIDIYLSTTTKWRNSSNSKPCPKHGTFYLHVLSLTSTTLF